MRPQKEIIVDELKGKLKDKETCNETLKFLNYYRKNQCEKVKSSSNGFTTFYRPYNDQGCNKVLNEMEAVAKDCSETFGFKR